MHPGEKEALSQIYRAAVAAADPYTSVKSALKLEPGELVIGGARYRLTDIDNIYIIAAGKAACGMAKAAEDVLGGLITEGAAITAPGGCLARPSRIRVMEASHPVPDERSVAAALAALRLAEKAGEGDLILCLLSGGASALMALPAKGITLDDKRLTTGLLLKSGADIAEVNAVRKHLSAIKGGRLAQAAYPAQVASLIISDVPGDDIGTIASGPTAPDPTTFAQASEMLRMRGAYARLPAAVINLLERCCKGLLPETPKPGDMIFSKVQNQIVADNQTALEKAREVAGYLGFSVRMIPDGLHGEAREAGARLAGEAAAYSGPRPACLITGGETTVTVRGGGMGGRNQETALAFALGIDGLPGINALFAGTDGIDGPTEAAGAFADGETRKEARDRGLDPFGLLENNDSHRFFEALGDLFITGPTGTNVMDIGIIVIK